MRCRIRGWTPSRRTWRWAIRADQRDYGIGLQILQDLGLQQVRLLTNNPKKTDAFVIHGYGLEVVGQVPIIAPEEAERRHYLAAKRDKLGHRLPRNDDHDEPPTRMSRAGLTFSAPAGFRYNQTLGPRSRREWALTASGPDAHLLQE